MTPTNPEDLVRNIFTNPQTNESGKSMALDKLKIERYTRAPFEVDAVQVTADNLEQVAEWCSGDVRTDKNGTDYIAVRVLRPMHVRQTMAYVGDWVLYAGRGYKVYTDDAFEKTFSANQRTLFSEVEDDG